MLCKIENFRYLLFLQLKIFSWRVFQLKKKFKDAVVSGFERNQAFTTRRQLLKPGGGRSRLLEKILPWGTTGGDFFQNPKGLALRGYGRWALSWPKWFKWRFSMGWSVIVNMGLPSFLLWLQPADNMELCEGKTALSQRWDSGCKKVEWGTNEAVEQVA